MASRGLTRKQMKQNELLDAATDFGGWLEDNWKRVLYWVAGAAAIGLLVLAWYYMDKARAKDAQDLLGQAYRQYFAAEGELPGVEGTYAGAIELFEKASDKAGRSATGRIAEFYRGLSLLRTGEVESSIEVLREVVDSSAGEPLLRESASVALSHAYARNGDNALAAETMQSLADQPEAAYPPDMALVLAGRFLQEGGDDEAAREVWREVLDSYPESTGAVEARALLGE